jgi:hypothetical protein
MVRGALVLPYDPNLNGVSYVLKQINQPDGDWDFRKLHLFHPLAGEEKVTKTFAQAPASPTPALAQILVGKHVDEEKHY